MLIQIQREGTSFKRKAKENNQKIEEQQSLPMHNANANAPIQANEIRRTA
jgi:hypothetical protein